jgi:hypothetical protein
MDGLRLLRRTRGNVHARTGDNGRMGGDARRGPARPPGGGLAWTNVEGGDE